MLSFLLVLTLMLSILPAMAPAANAAGRSIEIGSVYLHAQLLIESQRLVKIRYVQSHVVKAHALNHFVCHNSLL